MGVPKSSASGARDKRLSYALAVVFVVAAVMVRFVFWPVLGGRGVTVTFFPAIIFAALYGGRGPGLLATLLSAFAMSFWMEPLGLPAIRDPWDWVVVGIFLGSSALIAWITDAMQKAQGRAEAEMALSAERNRVQEELRKNQKVLEEELAIAIRLRDLSTQLIDGGGEQELYERMLETAMTIMEADFASIQALTEAQGSRKLRLLAWKNFHPESARFWDVVAAGSASACGAALERGERVIIADVGGCELLAGTGDLEEYRRSGIRAVQSTPLISRSGRLLGMISTHWRAPHTPAERGLCVLDVLARQVADMMERKQQEEMLRESEERLRLSLRAGRSGCFVWDIATNLVTADPTHRAMWGLHPNTALSPAAIFKLIHPDDVERVKREEQAGFVAGHQESEFRIVRPDGEIRWLAALTDVIRGADGKAVKVAGLNWDITERKRAEEALLERERQFRALADSIPNLAWWANADGYITWYNRKWYEYTGTTLEQMQGWGWQNVHEPEMLLLVLERWRSSITTGEPFEMEFPLRVKTTGPRLA